MNFFINYFFYLLGRNNYFAKRLEFFRNVFMELSEFVLVILEKNFPFIQKCALEKLDKSNPNFLNNEREMRVIFQNVFYLMPPSLRIQVSEKDFLKFCMENRHRIFELEELA